MREIHLSSGATAFVDDEDFERVNIGSWQLRKNRRALYAVRSTRRGGRRTVYMHRFILNVGEGVEVDHVNGNGLDNRKVNLRICSHAQNCMNIGKKDGSTSRFRGVRWAARIRRWTVSCQGSYVGCFTDEIAAAEAYNVAARDRFGEFARLNDVSRKDT